MPRCACRPGCLSWLSRDDDIVITADGPALRAHLEPELLAPQEALFEMAEVTS